ncbi:MAG: cobaltochelatase subunit CobN, partial [Victivallaceae bacterium]
MKLRFLLALLVCLTAVAAHAKTVVFLGGANDSDLYSEAFAELKLPETVKLEHYCVGLDTPETIAERARAADVVVINALVIELRELAAGGGIDFAKTKLYALSSRRLPKGLPALEPPELRAYRENRRPVNFRNMAYWIINRELDAAVKFDPPQSLPEVGATHPDAGKIFPSLAAYREWAETSGRWFPGRGVVAFAVHAASINPAELALFRHLTDEFARQRLNVVVVYGDEVRLIRELLLDADGKAAVDAVLALSFKFKSGLGEPLRQAMADLDVPVFNALRLYRQTTAEWQSSVRGMNDFAVAFGFIAPEISGMIEPSLLFGNRVVKDGKGREVQEGEPFADNIRITVERLQKWVELRRKANAEKHVAIFIYNGSGGKQNIGASYLNVPR